MKQAILSLLAITLLVACKKDEVPPIHEYQFKIKHNGPSKMDLFIEKHYDVKNVISLVYTDSLRTRYNIFSFRSTFPPYTYAHMDSLTRTEYASFSFYEDGKLIAYDSAYNTDTAWIVKYDFKLEKEYFIENKGK